MKTPEEYLENLTFNPNTLAEEVIEIIKQVQKETWNEAIDKAAESAELVECDPMEFYVDKQSILKLKV